MGSSYKKMQRWVNFGDVYFVYFGDVYFGDGDEIMRFLKER